MIIDVIKNIATRARTIMEEHHNDLSPIYFGHFPSGACGNTSDMLALYLNNNGIEGIEYVCGKRDGRSHGWLEVKGNIVDITSDQFDDGMGDVYIGKTTDFYNSFSEQSRSNPSISDDLIEAYNTFKKLMDEKSEILASNSQYR